MIANYLPLNDDPNVPEIVYKLRKDLDDRLMDLYTQAIEKASAQGGTAGVSETVHVPYSALGLHVVAIFHEPTSVFTQLIARPMNERDVERPSFTISLFLSLVPTE